jgi:hypothetical protein
VQAVLPYVADQGARDDDQHAGQGRHAGRWEAGSHAATWRPKGLSGGVYLYVLRAGDITLSGKAVLVR